MELTVKDSIREIKRFNLEDDSGLIIINTGMAGGMKRAVRKTLENPGSLPRTVVVTMQGYPHSPRDKYPNQPGVDGITSTSMKDPEKIRSFAREIVASMAK